MADQQRLLELTKDLSTYNLQAEEQFLNFTKNDNYTVDFYNEVKPFADKVHQTADEWKTLALEWVKLNNPTHLFTHQIEDTYDNLFSSAVTAFQSRTRKRKFLQTISSISYILDLIIQEIEQ